MRRQHRDTDFCVGLTVIVILLSGTIALTYYIGTRWVYNARAEDSAAPDRGSSDVVYKKGDEHPEDASSEDLDTDTATLPDTELQAHDEQWGDKDDATVDAVLTRLVRKLEKGEITLPPCACGGGETGAGGEKVRQVVNVTQVTNVTTRLQYQCLVSDKMRWAVLERDLKKAVAEETDLRMADMQAETDREIKNVTERTRENKMEGEDNKKRLAELYKRLQEFDSRLALEPHVMEMRGFMKIETFGPVLLTLGALHILTILAVCLLYARH